MPAALRSMLVAFDIDELTAIDEGLGGGLRLPPAIKIRAIDDGHPA